MAELLADAGFAVRAHLLREPDETEPVQQAHLYARKQPWEVCGRYPY
jgi:hypothetical protein